MIPGIREIGFGPGTEKAYATLHQATASFQEMGERSISTQVRIDGDIVPDFSGWELEFKGERFILPTTIPQAAKDNTTLNSLVDLNFTSWAIEELKRYYFMSVAQIDSGTAIADQYKASVILPLENFVELFNKVLQHYFGDDIRMDLFGMGTGIYSKNPVSVEINYTHIWDVLQKMYELFKVRWRIEYENGAYVIKVGYAASDISDHDFEYGYEGGLLRFERQVQDETIRNILLGRGGEKNLPYRYFKLQDPDNTEWEPDPDAIPELANIYFDRLRDAAFRWYVRGWMQNPNRDRSWDSTHTFPTYSNIPEEYQYAYNRGRTDAKFNPVEFAKDDESIAKYGERWGALEDDDQIYPTIQGVVRPGLGRVDEIVDVSEITTDDIEGASKEASTVREINGTTTITNNFEAREQKTDVLKTEEFTIPSGSTGNLQWTWLNPRAQDGAGVSAVSLNTGAGAIVAVNVNTGVEYAPDGLPSGTYYAKITLNARNYNTSGGYNYVTYGLDSLSLKVSVVNTETWKPTFEIWVKDIWDTRSGQGSESDEEYAARIWEKILGDRVGNEAKVVFSTGFMSISEDYEFQIAEYPVVDRTKTITVLEDDGQYHTYQSEWKITLRKSDAEFDSTGKYIPSADGGKPQGGDNFYFIGIDMPYIYVQWAEEDLHAKKVSELGNLSDINPTWVINLDKVRVHTIEDADYGTALADRLAAGATVWIKDKRFTPGDKLQLYVQSITYTWNEPSEGSPYIVPDIEVVLSDKVNAVQGPVAKLQGSVDVIRATYAKSSDIESVVRRVASPLFLKKTGEADSSVSPTKFASRVSSNNFRQGDIGGAGWGFYNETAPAPAQAQTRLRMLRAPAVETEETNEDSVLELDKLVVRKEMKVNTIVANQISFIGGKQVKSAATIECTQVVYNGTEYICYFDQKQGSVSNLFKVGDFAMGQDFDPQNIETRYYRARVEEVGANYIVLSKTVKDGAGVPEKGDTIVQYGNDTDVSRQYAIITDVIGGGYERMISGLNAVNANGVEYYFAGRESGSRERWFVGAQAGEYAEYKNGQLNIKGRLTVLKSDGTYQSMSEYISGVNTTIKEMQAQIDGQVQSWASGEAETPQTEPFPQVVDDVVDPSTANFPADRWTLAADKEKHIGDIYVDDSTGQGYRYTKRVKSGATEYYWTRITDEELAKALQDIQALQTGLAGMVYLKNALWDGSTIVDSGLVLTSLVQLGQKEGGVFKVYSGINGTFDTTLVDPTKSIAAWYGGPMVDHEADPRAASYAKSMFRMDGSGYLAGGNIGWNSAGEGHIPGITWSGNDILISGTVKLASPTGDSVTDLINAVRKLDWFTVENYTEGGVEKSRLKLNTKYAGLYSDGFITAGGVWSGGGGGGIDLDRVWESLTNNTDKPNVKINVAHIPNLEISNINGLSAALADAGKVKKVQVGSGNPVEPDSNGIIKLPAYLPLSGGTMTGGITMPSGGSSVGNTKGLMFTDNCSITTSTNNNMAIRSQGKVYITSYYGMDNQKGILIDGDTFTYGDQTIYHAGNLTVGVLTGLLGNTYHPYLGSSSLAFTARTLTITADATIAHIAFQRASANYITAPENGRLCFVIGKNSIGASLATLRIGSDDVTVNGYGTPGILNIFNTANNQDAGSIFFGALNGTRNGFKISSIYTANACRQSLVFYCSSNWSDPFTFTPVELMRLTHNGRVGIKNSDPAYVLDVSGVTRVASLKIGDGTPVLSWDDTNKAWKLTGNFYATGFVAAGGVGSGGGGGGGADLLDVWISLRDNYTTDEYYNWKVNAGHLPLGNGLTVDRNGFINVTSAPQSEITLTGVVTGTGTTTINTSIADNALTIAKTSGLQAALDGRVSNVTYSNEQLHVTKGGNTTDLTIAFATYTRRLKRVDGTSESGGYNLNTLLNGGGITSQYTSTGYWANAPAGMSYGSAMEIATGTTSLSAQVAWDVNHNSETPTRRMWWRARSSSHGWQNDWHLIYDSSTLTKAVITGLLGTEYHPYLGNTSLDFSAKDLTLNGALTGATTGNFSSVLTADRLVLTNTSMVSHIAFSRDSANYITAPTGGTIAFVPNGLTVEDAGAVLWVHENSVMVKGPSLSTPGVLKIMNNTSNTADAGEILFQSYTKAYSPDTTPQNGFRIAAEGASYRRQSLNFYSSDNRSGDYSPIWKRAMRISYTGDVLIGNTTEGSEFFPTLYSYGDLQVGYASNAATMNVFGRSTLAGGIAIGTSTNAQSDYLEWDERNRAWHLKGNLYADGFITAGGVGAGGQEEGATLLTVWRSLTNNPYLVDSDITTTTKIAAAHIPVGSGLQVVNGVINAIGQVESVVGLTGEINQSQLRTALGLGSLAYRNNITKSYITDFPTAVSAFTNDAGYITGITLTGVVTGSGTTSINTSIADNALTIAKTNGLQAALDGRVSNVTYSNEQLHVTKGGNTTDLTIAFATYTRGLKRLNGTSEAGGYNLNTLLSGGGITSQYTSTGYWANAPAGMSYGSAMEIATGTTSLSAQVAWDVNHNSETPTRRMWWRAKSSSHEWQNDWHLIYDSSTLTKSVITGLLGTEYHPYGGSSSLSILADAVSAATVSASGTGTFKNIVLTDTSSTARIEFSRSGLNYLQIPSDGKLAIVANSSRTESNSTAIFSATAVNPGVSGAIELGYYSESSSGSQLWSNISAQGMQLVKSGGATLYIRNHTGNGDAGSIIFRSSYGEQSNGFKIAAEATTGSYQIQTLNFYCSNNRSGSSPYTPIWQRAMRISYNGNVIIGNSTSGSEFYPTLYSYGNFQVGLSGNAATMDVYGAAILRSTLGVADATTLNNTLTVSGATTLNNTLLVSGATTMNSTLSVAGAITLTGTSSSTAVINFSRAGANYITTPESGTLNIVTNGRTKTIANSTMIVGVDDVTVQGATMTVQGVGAPGVLNIFNNTNNASAGSIFFSSHNRNGFKISSVYSADACRQSLVFYRSNNRTSPYEFTPIELMRLTHDGKVGINNSSPAYELDVTGTVRATALRLGDGAPEMVWDGTNNAWRLKGNFYADGFVSAGGLGNSDNAVLVTLAGTQTITGAKTFSGTATFTGAIRLRNTVTIGTSSSARAVTLYGTLSVSSSLTAGAVSIVDDGGYPLISSANTRLYLQDSQDLVLTTGNSSHTVIGTYVSPGTYKLYVNGMANATRWDTSSDCRLKKDRVAIDNVWDVLLKLQPKEWIWNHNSNLDGQKGAGFIAQEVEPILPFAVHGTDYKTLDYTAFHAYEIAGLQDHESRIKALEKENKELKEKVKQLEMR